MKANLVKKILISTLIIIHFILPDYVSAANSEKTASNSTVQSFTNSDIKAPSVILSDSGRGQILFGRETGSKLHVAALCKLMTILVALESDELNSSVTISKDSLVDSQFSAINLEAGDKYALEDLLHAIMLTSANDAANAVAEHISKDVPSFVKKMNDTALRLKMKDTYFINPTGLYDKLQYTTAQDISVFIRYAIKNPDFSRIFGIQVKPWTYKDGKSIILTSPNKLFWSYSNIEGGKTAYNAKDKQSIIAVASKDGLQLIGIILDSPEETLFSDATALFDYGFGSYKKSILVQKGEEIKTVQTDDSTVTLISGSDEYYVHPVGDNFIKGFSASVDLTFPVLTTKLSGNARYVLGDDTIIDVGLYPASQAPPPADDFVTAAKKKLLQYKDILILLIFLLLIEAVLLIIKIVKLIKWLTRKLFRKASGSAPKSL